jgi:hypothetical protein
MLFILVSAALAQAAATTTPSPTPQVPVEVVAPQQPRRICRIERDTGSHMGGRRICQTAQERDQERARTQRDVADSVAQDWDRQQVGRINQPIQTDWVPNGVTGIRPGPR